MCTFRCRTSRPRQRSMSLLGGVLGALGILWVAWAIPQLARGPVELSSHWWSTPELLLLAAGLALVLAPMAAAATRQRWKKI